MTWIDKDCDVGQDRDKFGEGGEMSDAQTRM